MENPSETMDGRATPYVGQSALLRALMLERFRRTQLILCPPETPPRNQTRGIP
jgi:hypothetical protein